MSLRYQLLGLVAGGLFLTGFGLAWADRFTAGPPSGGLRAGGASSPERAAARSSSAVVPLHHGGFTRAGSLLSRRGIDINGAGEVRKDSLVPPAPTSSFARTATAGAAGPGGLPRGSRACQSSPRSGLFVVTSYCDHGTTASGRQAGPGQCAGPRWVPLGTVVWIEGYGRAVVTDRTALRFNGRWDVWLPTRAAAMAWGKRTVRVEVVSTPQKSDSR